MNTKKTKQERKDKIMRTVEDIKKDYAATKINDEIIQIDERTERIYGFKNADERKALREEYIKTLPKNQQLAIWLHENFCDSIHTERCSFYNEIHNLEDDWTAPSHENYLLFANALLRVKNDVDFIIKVLMPMKVKKIKKN